MVRPNYHKCATDPGATNNCRHATWKGSVRMVSKNLASTRLVPPFAMWILMLAGGVQEYLLPIFFETPMSNGMNSLPLPPAEGDNMFGGSHHPCGESQEKNKHHNGANSWSWGTQSAHLVSPTMGTQDANNMLFDHFTIYFKVIQH